MEGVKTPTPELLFYDGDCGLCHRAVTFVIQRDPAGSAFRFAPLGGERFRATVPEALRAGLPDSLVVWTHRGELLTRSRAALYIGQQLGGFWRAAAALGRWVPRPWADAVYDLIARVRHRLFAAPQGVCPLLPPHLAQRFDP